jgi:hypothetical protein
MGHIPILEVRRLAAVANKCTIEAAMLWFFIAIAKRDSTFTTMQYLDQQDL